MTSCPTLPAFAVLFVFIALFTLHQVLHLQFDLLPIYLPSLECKTHEDRGFVIACHGTYQGWYVAWSVVGASSRCLNRASPIGNCSPSCACCCCSRTSGNLSPDLLWLFSWTIWLCWSFKPGVPNLWDLMPDDLRWS